VPYHQPGRRRGGPRSNGRSSEWRTWSRRHPFCCEVAVDLLVPEFVAPFRRQDEGYVCGDHAGPVLTFAGLVAKWSAALITADRAMRVAAAEAERGSGLIGLGHGLSYERPPVKIVTPGELLISVGDRHIGVLMLVGGTGIEPVTSSVSGMRGQFPDLLERGRIAADLRKVVTGCLRVYQGVSRSKLMANL